MADSKSRKTFSTPQNPSPTRPSQQGYQDIRQTQPMGPPGGEEFDAMPTRVDIRAYHREDGPDTSPGQVLPEHAGPTVVVSDDLQGDVVVLPPVNHEMPTMIGGPDYPPRRPAHDAPTAAAIQLPQARRHASPPAPAAIVVPQPPSAIAAAHYAYVQTPVPPQSQAASAAYVPPAPAPYIPPQGDPYAAHHQQQQQRPPSNRPPAPGPGAQLAVSQDTRIRIVQPRQEGELSPALIMLYAAASPAANQFRLLRYRIEQEPNSQIFAVACAKGGEGCTTTAANLALALAEGGRVRVLLVDVRLRNPMIARLFGISNEDGISSMLARVHRDPNASFDIVAVAPSFFILPAGPPAANPYSVLASDEAARMVGELRREFRYVVVDAGPILTGAEGLAWQGIIEYFLIVGRAGKTTTEDLQLISERIRRDKILGVVLNGRQGKKQK